MHGAAGHAPSMLGAPATGTCSCKARWNLLQDHRRLCDYLLDAYLSDQTNLALLYSHLFCPVTRKGGYMQQGGMQWLGL